MSKPSIPSGWRRFWGDCRGSTAALFALAAIPTLGVIGAALDYSRASGIRTVLQTGADSAALAAARETSLPWAKRQDLAKQVFQSHVKMRSEISSWKIVTKEVDGAIRVDASGSVVSTMARLFGVDKIEANVRAEVRSGAASNLELAIVLDTTGSMRNDMDALRKAAADLVDKVMGGGSKVAVVPYVAAVNPGKAALSTAWLDSKGDSKFHAISLEEKRTFMRNGCDPGWGSGGGGGGGGNNGPGNGGGSDRSSLDDVLKALNNGFAQLFGVTPVYAASYPKDPNATTDNGGPIPSGWTKDRCFLYTPKKINHFDLFAQIPDQPWKGCVEARPAPYDVTDAPPNPANADTLFVPYFWPDEPDKAINGAWGAKYPNNYLSEQEPPIVGYDYDGAQPDGDSGRYTSILKYNGRTTTAQPTAPKSSGPNASCPDPIVPLTNSKATVQQAIANLKHWEGGGTVSSEGLMWGWRVLSPGAPFTEGAPYGKAEKVIVLMTDGVNEATTQVGWGCCETDHTAYGTLNSANWDRKLFGSWKHQAFSDFMDQRLAEACKNVKKEGIQIFTVMFNVNNPKTAQLYKDCATSPTMYFDAKDQAQLATAFSKIGNSLQGALRLTR